ncbi:MAG: hypothetical protein BWY15_01698 [Firmicutes bacterium ADurb.Bin193]|nr:MAG: hypothetical protein BWY15_01698 [Firmicutes bacterium ADurb.Bin193]
MNNYDSLKMKEKKVAVEYLYLDLKTCDRCIGTDAALEEVLEKLIPALSLAGYTVEYKKTEITNEALAKQYKFLSSPTIRVNGRDICSAVKESDCGCCGEICEDNVECRVFEYEGKLYEIPPKAMLAEAILKNIFGKPTEKSYGGYSMPDNLKVFFEGKNKKRGCSCGPGCC